MTHVEMLRACGEQAKGVRSVAQNEQKKESGT